MLERLQRLLGWLCRLLRPATAAPGLTRRPPSIVLPEVAPPCRSWPLPRHGATGAAAIRRAARQRRQRRRARRA